MEMFKLFRGGTPNAQPHSETSGSIGRGGQNRGNTGLHHDGAIAWQVHNSRHG
ncbi:hypothetical protein PISMIDRAFT_674316 [Pisolithus microcarpus 441]|uniref:Uncharacterized protein n=1 Tax=Pisolithus microcarpus 441 TaxID=765257 RepID=A0A0D0A0S2_9AGAM|nr:hypothetical protein PISMIDRAFT_674316 [Pisolithus microcarpus 441]